MAGERGRPRTFDPDQALDQALHVFWKQGFQDASMQDLTSATGLSKPSLYAAFGDKEALYLKTLERYLALLVERHAHVLRDEADGERAIRQFMLSMADMFADPALPGGCFVVNGTADCGGSTIPASVEAALRAALQGSEGMILDRLQRARRDRQLAAGTDCATLAAMFMSIIAGLAVLARSGATHARLAAVIDAAMKAWPGPTRSARRSGQHS